MELSRGQLIYTGRDNYQTGAECLDGSFIDPTSVNLDEQSDSYVQGAAELRSLATEESLEGVYLHSNAVEPLGITVDINGARPFRKASELCSIDGDVQSLGRLSTGELLVRLSPEADKPFNNSCKPGTYALLDQRGRPTY